MIYSATKRGFVCNDEMLKIYRNVCVRLINLRYELLVSDISFDCESINVGCVNVSSVVKLLILQIRHVLL